MKTEVVKVTEENIEDPKPQQFYQAFYRNTPQDDWWPFLSPCEGEQGKEQVEQSVSHWNGVKPEFKLISFEIER